MVGSGLPVPGRVVGQMKRLPSGATTWIWTQSSCSSCASTRCAIVGSPSLTSLSQCNDMGDRWSKPARRAPRMPWSTPPAARRRRPRPHGQPQERGLRAGRAGPRHPDSWSLGRPLRRRRRIRAGRVGQHRVHRWEHDGHSHRENISQWECDGLGNAGGSGVGQGLFLLRSRGVTLLGCGGHRGSGEGRETCWPRHPSSSSVATGSTLRTSGPVRGPSIWSSWPALWRSRCAGRSRARAGPCAAWPASAAWSRTTRGAWATRTAWTCHRPRPSRTWWPTSRPWWRRPGSR